MQETWAARILNERGTGIHVPLEEMLADARHYAVLDEVTTEKAGNDDDHDQWLFLTDGSYLVYYDPMMQEGWDAGQAQPDEIVELPADDQERRFAAKWTGQSWLWLRGWLTITWEPA